MYCEVLMANSCEPIAMPLFHVPTYCLRVIDVRGSFYIIKFNASICSSPTGNLQSKRTMRQVLNIVGAKLLLEVEQQVFVLSEC